MILPMILSHSPQEIPEQKLPAASSAAIQERAINSAELEIKKQ